MAITLADFNKIWASTSPLTPYSFSKSNYKQGWNFIGSTPPARQMWDFLQKNNDEKMQYLANNYLPLSGGTITGDAFAPTPTAGDDSTKIATTEFVTNDLKAQTMLLEDNFVPTIPNGADLDDYTTAGTYRTTGASATSSLVNCPTIGFSIKLVVTYIGYGSSGYCMQRIYSGSQAIFVRSRTATSWTEWKRVAYAEDVLPLSGGTMTGTITISRNTSAEFTGINTNFTKNVTFPSSALTLSAYRISDSNDSIMGGVFGLAYSDKIVTTVRSHGNSVTSRAGINVTCYNDASKEVTPDGDNSHDLGSSTARWKQLYAGTTTIATSDERLKDNIEAIPDDVLDAWGEVGWYQYQFKDSIAEKGEKARLHTGAIAQRIESIFKSHGLDANRYGLLCYDEWEAEEEQKDEDGNVVQEAREAGNRYSLRYEEALCMEAAYQRRRADRLEERIARLEELMRTE